MAEACQMLSSFNRLLLWPEIAVPKIIYQEKTFLECYYLILKYDA